MTAWLLLFVVVVCFSGFSLCMKLGGRAHNSPFAVSFSIFTTGAVLMGGYMLATGSHLFTAPVVFWGVMCGVTSAIAVVMMVKALQLGHYGFSVAVLSMSSLLPVMYSVVFLDKPLGLMRIVGMGVIFLALFMITCFGRTPSSGGNSASRAVWLLFLFGAFVLNGLALVSHAGVAALEQTNFFSFLFVMYVVSGAALVGFVITRRSLNRKAVFFGMIGAVASAVGCISELECLGTLPASIVFPISQCMPVIVGVVLSRVTFKEQIRLAGYLGIAIGLLGVTILCSF